MKLGKKFRHQEEKSLRSQEMFNAVSLQIHLLRNLIEGTMNPMITQLRKGGNWIQHSKKEMVTTNSFESTI